MLPGLAIAHSAQVKAQRQQQQQQQEMRQREERLSSSSSPPPPLQPPQPPRPLVATEEGAEDARSRIKESEAAKEAAERATTELELSARALRATPTPATTPTTPLRYQPLSEGLRAAAAARRAGSPEAFIRSPPGPPTPRPFSASGAVEAELVEITYSERTEAQGEEGEVLSLSISVERASA